MGLTTIGNCLLAGMFSEPNDPLAFAGAAGSLPSDPCPEVLATKGGLAPPIAAGLGGTAGAGLAAGGLTPGTGAAGRATPVGGLAGGGRAPNAGRGVAGGLAAFAGGRVPGGMGRAVGMAAGRPTPGGLVERDGRAA